MFSILLVLFYYCVLWKGNKELVFKGSCLFKFSVIFIELKRGRSPLYHADHVRSIVSSMCIEVFLKIQKNIDVLSVQQWIELFCFYLYLKNTNNDIPRNNLKIVFRSYWFSYIFYISYSGYFNLCHNEKLAITSLLLF